MDKTARVILGFAVAIIYPVLVFLAVIQLVPKPDKTSVSYPNYPNYDECYDYNYLDSYDSCTQRKNQEYERAKENYHNQHKNAIEAENNYALRVASIVMIVMLISIVGAYFLRDIRELAGSIGFGSAVTVAISAIVIAGIGWKSDNKVFANTLILFGFLVGTIMLTFIEKNIHDREEAITASNAPPAKPIKPDSNVQPSTNETAAEQPELAVGEPRTKPDTEQQHTGSHWDKNIEYIHDDSPHQH